MSNMEYVREWQEKMEEIRKLDDTYKQEDQWVLRSSDAESALWFILNSLEYHCEDGYILAKAQLIEMASRFGAPRKNG